MKCHRSIKEDEWNVVNHSALQQDLGGCTLELTAAGMTCPDLQKIELLHIPQWMREVRKPYPSFRIYRQLSLVGIGEILFLVG